MTSSNSNEILIEEQAVEKKVSFYFTSLILGTFVIFIGLWLISALLYYVGNLSESMGGPGLEMPIEIWYLMAFILLLTLLLLISGIINHVKRRVRFNLGEQVVEELDADNRVVFVTAFFHKQLERKQ